MATGEKNNLKQILESGFYKSLSENLPDAVYVLDLEGHYIDVNPACVKLFGYTRDQLLNMSFKQNIVPAKLNQWESEVARQWVQGKSVTVETTIVQRDGQRVELHITDTPILIDGNVVGVFGIAKDITEQKKTEKLLKERSEWYESLKKYNPNGICSFGLDGTVIGANPAYERITGYSLEELRQMTETEALLYPEGQEQARKTFKYLLTSKETQIKHKDGHLVDVSATSVPIIVDGEQIGVYLILQDITIQKQVQQELLNTQRLYKIISENSQDIISCSYPPHFTISYISPSIQTLLGYDPDELVGKPNVCIFHPGDVEYITEIDRRISEGENVPRFTCRVRCKNGNYLWYETTLKITRDEQGKVLEIYGIGRDVSEQMNLQESLEQAVRIAGLGHYERDIQNGTIVYSDQTYRILGIKPRKEGFTYQEFCTFIHPEDVEVFNRNTRKCLETGQPFDRVYRIVRKDGSIRYLHSQGEVLLDDSVVPSRIVGTVTDITEQKLLQMQLYQSEERFRRLVENSLDAICIFENRKWVFMNRVGLRMFGVNSEDEIIGRDYFDFLDPSHHEESLNRLQVILSRQKVDPIEYKWIRTNGEVFYAEVLGSPFGDNAVQICIRDITDRKKTDELLLRSEKLTAAGQLAAGVAHEIRNPLTALKGFTKILHEKSQGKDRQYFEIMKGEFERIEMIVSEMLLLAKPQAIKFKPQHADLILQEVITLLSAQAVMKNVVIQTDFERNIPEILGDESQLKQVFINILKNGIEATPPGGNLFVRLVTEDRTIYVEFIDEGEGIPQDSIPKLGEPLFTTKEMGTGLGLTVCHKLISAHNGSIEFSSKVGEGTKVSISLPIKIN